MAATIQKPVPITPAPALPLPTNRPPKETQEKTNPEPSVPLRRPVTYPQLLEGSTLVTPIAGCSGLRINVALKVSVDGSVLECKVLSAIRPECAEAAKAIALRYRFKPALDAQGLPLETTLAAAVDLPEVP